MTDANTESRIAQLESEVRFLSLKTDMLASTVGALMAQLSTEIESSGGNPMILALAGVEDIPDGLPETDTAKLRDLHKRLVPDEF